MTKIFEVNETWYGVRKGETVQFDGKIELDNRILDVVDDKWRSQFYSLKNEQEIANHIAFNMIVNRAKVWELDGWANMPHDVVARVL